MSKTTLVKPAQIKEAFQKLPTQDKIKLTKEFEKITRRLRWHSTLTKIRSRVKKYPISQKQINLICEETRKKLYDERTKSRN